MKAGQERSAAGCPLLVHLAVGPVTAAEHLPPVPACSQAAASLSFGVLCCFSSCGPAAGTAGTVTLCFEAGCLHGTGDLLSQTP